MKLLLEDWRSYLEEESARKNAEEKPITDTSDFVKKQEEFTKNIFEEVKANLKGTYGKGKGASRWIRFLKRYNKKWTIKLYEEYILSDIIKAIETVKLKMYLLTPKMMGEIPKPGHVFTMGYYDVAKHTIFIPIFPEDINVVMKYKGTVYESLFIEKRKEDVKATIAHEFGHAIHIFMEGRITGNIRMPKTVNRAEKEDLKRIKKVIKKDLSGAWNPRYLTKDTELMAQVAAAREEHFRKTGKKGGPSTISQVVYYCMKGKTHFWNGGHIDCPGKKQLLRWIRNKRNEKPRDARVEKKLQLILNIFKYNVITKVEDTGETEIA